MEQQEAVETEPQAQELQDQSEETQVETNDEQDEQDVAEVSESEAQGEEPQAEVAETAVVEEDEEEESSFNPQAFQQPQAPQLPPIDINQFVDTEGRIDMVAYNQAIQNQFQQQLAAVQQQTIQQATQYTTALSQYEKDWHKAEDRFPQLKGKQGKDLKDMVQAIHAQSAANPNGKYLSPLKAAEKFFGATSQAKAEGIKTAQETRTVQQAATLANPNPPAEPQDRANVNNLKETMRRGTTRADRQQATNAYLTQLIEKGML